MKLIPFAVFPTFIRSVRLRIEASEIGSRLARGAFWSIIGAILSRGLMLAGTVLLARILGKTGYGELGIVQSTVVMLGAFASAGLGVTATKHVAELRCSNPVRAGRIAALSSLIAAFTGGLMALFLLIFAPWLAEHTIAAPHLTGVLRIGALLLFLSAINGVQIGVLSGFESFKTIAQINLKTALLSFPILVLSAYGGGLTGAVWALAIGLGFSCLLSHRALHREAARNKVPLTLNGCSHEWAILGKFSIPAALGTIVVGPVHWACAALLVNQPHGYEEMGIFSAANQWFTMLCFLPNVMGGVVLPILSEKVGQKDRGRSLNALVMAIRLNLVVVVPLSLIGSVFSPYIMSLYGESFAVGWPTLVAALLTAAMVAAQNPIGQFISASGRMWLGFTMNMGWATVFIVMALLLVGYGSFGLALARALGYAAQMLWVSAFTLYLLRAMRQTNS